ncbi:MAG: gamma carbonic anhydrase family protein [Firmicutes bacterium]|nr:gamma carbonic anhydrase family protein [Bacillota bacterium]
MQVIMAKKISESAFLAQGSVVVGDVTVGENVGIWYNAVIRGDANTVVIGDNSNIQDCCVIHANEDQPVRLGKNVSLGHGAIIHGAIIGDNVLVGMGAIVMDGAEVGENTLIAAGALVTKGTKIPPNSLVVGSPAKVRREITPEELEVVTGNAEIYLAFLQKNRDGLWDMPINDVLAQIKK